MVTSLDRRVGPFNCVGGAALGTVTDQNTRRTALTFSRAIDWLPVAPADSIFGSSDGGRGSEANTMTTIDLQTQEDDDGLTSFTPLAWLILAPFVVALIGWLGSALP